MASCGQVAMPSPDSDADLARRAAGGDRSALEVLLGRHADRVHAICRRVVGDPDDALDATQEAMIAIARGVSRFDGRSAFTTWLYRVATNAALDELRRKRRRPRPTNELPDGSPAAGLIDDAVAARLDVDQALAALPVGYRVAVVLRDLGDLDYPAIAEILDLPVGTVRSRIARGRAQLKAALGNLVATPGRPRTDDE
jgi:RNA polymerase sigma-70 factor (ECF subfamily)